MPQDWIKAFGLRGDPFDTLALTTEGDLRSLFVGTEDVRTHIDPLLNSFKESRPFVRCIAGPRGSGKTTLLYYMEMRIRTLPDTLTAHVRHQREIFDSVKDPVFGVGADTLNGTLRELANAASKISDPPDAQLQSLLSAIGVEPSESESPSNQKIPEWSYPQRMLLLEKLLNHLQKSGHNKGLLAIDNYDKNLDQNLALEFLRSSWAQSLFEKIQACGFSVVISAKHEWGQIIAKEPDLSYLGHPIFLRELNPTEATSIVEHRILAKSTDPDREFPFERAAMAHITVKENGVAREILETCRSCMIEGHKHGRTVLDESFVRDFFVSEEEKGERYYDLIRNDAKAERGFTQLSTLKQELDADSFRRIGVSLVKQFSGQTIDEEAISGLREKRLVYLGPSLKDPSRKELTINSDIEALLKKLSSRYSLERFIDWVAKGTDPVLLVVPSAQEQESRRNIEMQLRQVLDLFRGYPGVHEAANDALAVYRSLMNDMDQKDFEIDQIVRNMSRCIFNLAEANFKANSVRGVPSPQNIQSFLEKNESTRKVAADYSVIRSLEEVARRGVPIESAELESLHGRFVRVLNELLNGLMETVPSLAEREPQGILPVAIKDADQLQQRIRAYIRSPDHLMVIQLSNQPINEFCILCWQHRNYVYALPCGNRNQYKELRLDVYELRTKHGYQIPEHVSAQLRTDSINYLTMLRYMNVNEFAQSILSMSLKTPTRVSILQRAVAVEITVVPAQYGSFEVTFRFSPPRWGSSLLQVETKTETEDLTGRAYNLMRQLEQNLNVFIIRQLSYGNAKWWDESIPRDVQEACAERKKRGEKPWPWYDQPELPLAAYFTFADYAKIIRKSWNKFAEVLGNRIVLAKLEELEPLRNTVMHPTPQRELSRVDYERMSLYHKDIMRCIARSV